MRKFLFIAVAAILCVFASADFAQAQTKKGTLESKGDLEVLANIAVVDMLLVRRDAASFKQLRSEINKYREQLKNDLRAEEAELQKANRELARQRAILTPEAFRDERKKFEERVGKLQQTFQARWSSLKEIEQDAETRILDVLQKATVEIAQKKQLIMIVRKRSLVFWIETLDITKDIITVLDKKMPKVSIKLPKDFAPVSSGKDPKKK
ncbi:MAG: OmpH family outer membrane protein [Rhodospirillales bacterium]